MGVACTEQGSVTGGQFTNLWGALGCDQVVLLEMWLGEGIWKGLQQDEGLGLSDISTDTEVFATEFKRGVLLGRSHGEGCS